MILLLLTACNLWPPWTPQERYACQRMVAARDTCMFTVKKRTGYHPPKPRELVCDDVPASVTPKSGYLKCAARAWEEGDCTTTRGYQAIGDQIVKHCQPLLHRLRTP